MVLVVATSEKDPKIYKEAIESINANLWKEAANSGLKSYGQWNLDFD